jgi:hypothetical protein
VVVMEEEEEGWGRLNRKIKLDMSDNELLKFILIPN